MDFIDLATWSHDILRRQLQYSQQLQQQQISTTATEDDDFAQISSSSRTSPASQYGYHDTATYGQQSDSILDHYYVDEYGAVGGTNNSGIGSRPVLSKSAEAELYLLATNFLLYVAMVIITILVAKIYFPESLQRNRGGGGFGHHGTDSRSSSDNSLKRGMSGGLRRTYSYHRRNEDEVDDDIGLPIASDSMEDSFYYDEDEVLDSGADGEDYDAEDDDDGAAAAEIQDLTGKSGGKTKSKGYGKKGGSSSRSGSMNFLEFDQERTSQRKVLQRLLVCSLMLNVTFVAWGVLQERMLTRRYPRYVGDYFTYSYALVFTNRFWTLIMSGILLWKYQPRLSRSTVLYEYSFPSISNMLSSWCQYEALRYVSFPATTLFKSFKLAPVMAMGKILGNKTYPQYDYVVALIIGVGVAMFMSSTDDLQWGTNNWGAQDAPSSAWTGVMLLLLFLFFDSFTSQFQSRMFQRHVDLSMLELMFATSAFSTVLSAITLVHTKELWAAMEFMYQHSEIHVHFFMFSICSTIGQLFIFYTIKNFGAVVFTLIMTTRIILSIALSCFMYGHSVTGTGFLGLMLVVGAVLYRIKKKAEGKQLIKWQGMDDEKGPELVQEWHEHVDM